MKVKYHATLGTIDASKHSGAPVGIGDPDKARIFVAIIDWNARHRVASGTKDPTGIWDPAETTQTAEGKLIAYGSLFVDKSTEGEQMVEATLPLNFYDPAAGRPTGKYSIHYSEKIAGRNFQSQQEEGYRPENIWGSRLSLHYSSDKFSCFHLHSRYPHWETAHFLS